MALVRLLEGAEASTDPSLALQLLVDASEAAVFSGQLATVVELSQRASSLQAATARDRLMIALLRASKSLVIFMNDNGGTAGVSVYNAGMRGQKNTPWLGGTRASS